MHIAVAGHDFNLNQSTLVQWQSVKGVGAKKAQAILDYKKQHGPFHAVDDLAQVKGVSPASIVRLQKKNNIRFVVHAKA